MWFFGLQVSVKFLVFLLLSISGFIPLWWEKISIFSTFLNLFRLLCVSAYGLLWKRLHMLSHWMGWPVCVCWEQLVYGVRSSIYLQFSVGDYIQYLKEGIEIHGYYHKAIYFKATFFNVFFINIGALLFGACVHMCVYNDYILVKSTSPSVCNDCIYFLFLL